jgi:hypothetical protein
MLTASLRRTVVLVPLIAVLATSGVSAVGPQTAGARPVLSTAELLDRILSFLRPHIKEGCKLDPNGRCHASTTQPPHTKEGCKIDPDGRCHVSTAQPPFSGCKIDPDGSCIP